MPSPKGVFSAKFTYQECLNADSVLSETDTFEQYPLIYRDFQYENWQKAFPSADIFSMWVGLAVFLLNFYKNLDVGNQPAGRFLCITVNDFDESESGQPPIPNIFTSTAIVAEEFLANLKRRCAPVDSNKMEIVKSGFARANQSTNFSFYESRFFDQASQSEIVRIYCI